VGEVCSDGLQACRVEALLLKLLLQAAQVAGGPWVRPARSGRLKPRLDSLDGKVATTKRPARARGPAMPDAGHAARAAGTPHWRQQVVVPPQSESKRKPWSKAVAGARADPIDPGQGAGQGSGRAALTLRL